MNDHEGASRPDLPQKLAAAEDYRAAFDTDSRIIAPVLLVPAGPVGYLVKRTRASDYAHIPRKVTMDLRWNQADGPIGSWTVAKHTRRADRFIWRQMIGYSALLLTAWFPVVALVWVLMQLPAGWAFVSMAACVAWFTAAAWLIWSRRFPIAALILGVVSVVPYWQGVLRAGLFAPLVMSAGLAACYLVGSGRRGIRRLRSDEADARCWLAAPPSHAYQVRVWVPARPDGTPPMGWVERGGQWESVSVAADIPQEMWAWISDGAAVYSAPDRARKAYERLQALTR